jgi:hypothetical protein
MTCSTVPASNVTWILSRALAGEFPYDPQQIEYRRHPSLSRRLVPESRFFVMEDDSDRSIQVAIEVVRRTARLNLKGKEVRHFEVMPIVYDDFSTTPHEDCDEEGCDDCNGLGVLFVPDPGQKVFLMGWLAVIYVGV